jgi:hypothetical protein
MTRTAPILILIACAGHAACAVATAPPASEGVPPSSVPAAPAPHSIRIGLDLQSVGRDDYDQFHGSGVIAVSEVLGERWDLGLALRGHYTWANGGGSGDLATGSLDYLIVPKVRFRRDSDFSPYVGLQLGAQTTWFNRQTGVVGGTSTPTYDRAIATTAAAGGGAGVDIYHDRSVSLFAEASSLYTYVDHDWLRAFDLAIGVSYWF